MKKHFLILYAFAFLIAGCKKYDEGPLMSLRSKTQRICNEWQFFNVEYIESGVTENVTSEFEDVTLAFFSGGRVAYNEYNAGVKQESETGKWLLSDDKDQLRYQWDGDTWGYLFDIL